MHLALLLTSLSSLGASDQDWPQFLGPHGDATAEGGPLSFDWGDDGPRILWRTGLGGGFGGPAVRDGVVYLLDREIGERDILRTFDLETGAELWRADYPAPGRLSFPGSRTVPSVQEKVVVTCGGFGQVSCFSREGGELLWQVDMDADHNGKRPIFGWSNSPLVHQGVVVVTPLGDDTGIVGLDLETGEQRWSSGRVGYSHSSPRMVRLHGRDEMLFLATAKRGSGRDQSAPTTIWSFDPASGALHWKHEVLLTRLPIPPPIATDDEHLFLTGGYRAGSTLLHVRMEEGEPAFEEVFHIERGSQIHPPILRGGHLYLLVNENWNDSRRRRKEGGLLCLSLSGEEMWRTGDDPYFGRGGMVAVGDHLLIQDGFTGVLRVVRASPERYTQVAEADVFGKADSREDGQMWAPLAVAGNRLLLRSQDELVCLEL